MIIPYITQKPFPIIKAPVVSMFGLLHVQV